MIIYYRYEKAKKYKQMQEITNQNGNNAFNNLGLQINGDCVIYNSKLQKDFSKQKFNFKIRKLPNLRIYHINEYFVMSNNLLIIALLSFILLYFLVGIRDLNSFLIVCASCLIYTLVYFNYKTKIYIDINGIVLNNENIKFKDIRKIKVRSNFIQKYAEIYFLNEHEPKFRIYTDDIYQLELVEEVFLSSIHQNQI